MDTLTKVLIGVGVGAVALIGIGLYESGQASAATPASPPPGGTPGGVALVSAAGPYTPATTTTQITPGKTYLVSIALPSGMTAAGATQAALQGALSSTGLGAVTVNQFWPSGGGVPPNWPAGDSDPSRVRASITYNGSTSVPLMSIAQAYASSGAASVSSAAVFTTGQ